MSIETTYNELILEEVLREFLVDGVIPTADMLIEAYELRVASHSDMTKPFILDEDHQVEEYADASAAEYNDFFSRARADLSALYKEIWERTADSMESFDRWRIEMERLKERLIDLDSRIDSLLLLRADTAGYFAFVEDNFVDLSKVNQEETTAKVDIVSHTVTLNDNLDDVTKIDLNRLQTQDATFTILTREYVLSSQEAPGSSVRYAVQDVARSWQHRVRSNQSSVAITGELKIKLASAPTDVSRIAITLHASNTNGAMILTGMYSNDNYNWYNLPCNNYVQSVDDRAMFVFPKTPMQWVKFLMTKTGADDVDGGQYIYEFGASSIEFFGTPGYDATTGNLLMSKELSAYNDDGEAILFNKVALQACEQLPDNTSIAYWITASNDTVVTPRLRIDPFNRENAVAPIILELGQMSETEVPNLGIFNGAAQEALDYFSSYSDILKSSRLFLLGTDFNTVFLIEESIGSRILDDQVTLYRNVGVNGGVPAVAERLVRNAPRGWHYDESRTNLITTIIVNNPNGLWLNFGNTNAVIDGYSVTGLTHITNGTHTFKTNTKNIAALPADFTEYSTEAELMADDSLYPYNHQLLIEGVPYSDSYEETKTYLGVDTFCEAIAQRVSIFDLVHNVSDTDFSKFALDVRADGKSVVVVNEDIISPYAADQLYERNILTYKTDDNMFDTIILEAELNVIGENDDITPVLTAYRVKLGV